jgi:hypothetical protein
MNSNYLLISREKSDNGKLLQKHFKKNNISKLFEYSYYKSDFKTESLRLISKFLSDIKTKQRSFSYKNHNYLGVLTDDNVILIQDILSIPEFPDKWDIVFLEYTLDKINYNSDNLAWKRIEVLDGRHFLINPYSLDKVQSVIKSSKNWNEFIKSINRLNVYGIQNMFFSEPLSHNIKLTDKTLTDKTLTDKTLTDKTLTDKTLTDKTLTETNLFGLIQNDFTNCEMINYKELVSKFDIIKKRYTPDKLYNIYPSISFICCITDTKLFLHTLYTFLSLDYPTDKIELIIVDDTDAEKRLKKHLPNDARLRFINIKPKTPNESTDNNSDPYTFSLGYKLNLATKYCKYDLLCHLFDTNVYFKNNFKNIIECYILSNKSVLTSIDSHSYNPNSKSNFVKRIPDLGNMIYTKSFWSSFNFKDKITDKHLLAYEFTKFRKQLIGYIPGIEWSFNIVKDDYVNLNKLPFDLIDLLDEKDKSSFEMSFD